MMTNTNLEKKIKRHIYGSPQDVQVVFPPGMGTIALNEANSILNNLWFPQKYTSQLVVLKNQLRINQIHLFAATELLMRNLCFTDIRLIIYEGKAAGKFAFEKKCRDIDWNMFLNKKMTLKIHVDSVASRAFHETGLKEILTTILQDYANAIVTGEDANPTTILYVNLYKNKLTISISLAGNPLYKRGYRGTLSASAPLREDMAACCIQSVLKWIGDPFVPDTILIPFSGTGTFAFEYLLYYLNIAPVLLGREYALTYMPFFRKDNFNFLLKKARENCLIKQSMPTVYCIDNSSNANAALLQNCEHFRNAMLKNDSIFPDKILSHQNADFFSFDFKTNAENILILINPPYGIRLGKNKDINHLYKNIAMKMNELSGKNKLGLILCPTKEAWSMFCNTLIGYKIETSHFTQGGMDIRLCQFYGG